MYTSNSLQKVTIEKLVHGGSGLARTDAGVVLVEGALSGETVLVTPAGKHGGMPCMHLVNIVEPSPFRRASCCPHFGICGGCDWLHLAYNEQVAAKKQIFIEAMQRIGKITGLPDIEILTSPELGYRRRVQIKISSDKQCGFFRKETNDVVRIDHCPLCSDGINTLLTRCNADHSLIPDTLHNCRAIEGDDGVASSPVIAPLTSAATAIRCSSHTMHLQGGDFVQSNRFLLEPLANWVAGHAEGNHFVDLYGGTGFFSLMLAAHFTKGYLIESEPGMVARAKENFMSNSINNVHPVAAPAEKMDRYIPKNPDVLIVDPPRPGLTREAREAIAKTAPSTIIYISCNCATQARDAAFFVTQASYQITQAALFDLYPNTHHTETVLIFKKSQIR